MRKEEVLLRGKEGKGSRKGGEGRGREGGRERFSANNVNHTPEGEREGLYASPPCRVTLEAAKERGRESLEDER